MIGPAGTGKTMMAKALPGVLPPLSREESLEVTRIYSSVGQVPADQPLMLRRPVRMPHHTASGPAIIGGGTVPRPGDVSLAHRGVLFLDEMPEFHRAVLETLRQPVVERRPLQHAAGAVQEKQGRAGPRPPHQNAAAVDLDLALARAHLRPSGMSAQPRNSPILGSASGVSSSTR